MSDTLRFDHPNVKRLRRLLGRRSARLEEGAFVVEGATLVAEAVAAGWRVESQYLAHDAPERLALPGVHTFRLAPGVLARVATTETPQPLLAVVGVRRVAVVDPEASLVLVADQINDPGNLGTMLRSAEAAGFDAVVATPGTVDAFNSKVVRASAGAIFHVQLVNASLGDIAAVAGMRLFGTSSHRGTPHDEVDWRGRVAIVVGNETHGLAPDAPVDEWVTIAHHGRAESLNVAMAAALLCFEAARGRHPGERPPGSRPGMGFGGAAPKV